MSISAKHTASLSPQIAVVDFGGQYAHLIAQRIRKLGYYSIIVNPEDFQPQHYPYLGGIIFSGGPASTTDEAIIQVAFNIQECQVPLLGICYGHQLIASLCGGTIESSSHKEYGQSQISCLEQQPLFASLPQSFGVWMSHADKVVVLPDDFLVTSSSSQIAITSFQHKTKPIYGLQFHPEVTHTKHGTRILENFLSLCEVTKNWDVANLRPAIVASIKEQTHNDHLFLLLSGGVDSLVTLALCQEAVNPEKIIALHIDNGFMRKNESAEILTYMQTVNLGTIHIAHAQDSFLNAVHNIIEPEQKRAIIGRKFIEVLKEQLPQLLPKHNWKLVQGTIYPDTIESGGTKNAVTIKTHHNRVPEIERMIEQGLVVEPLKDLYKDEVRLLGYELGLPEKLLQRHPFPGPGLAIRTICSNGKQTENLLPDLLSEDEHHLCKKHGLQTHVLPIRSVGVQGDNRTYRQSLLLTSTTAIGWDILLQVATALVNGNEHINRVLYHPSCNDRLQLKELYLNPHDLDRLREVDALFQDAISEIDEIWQAPVVALPLYDQHGLQTFVLRPITSVDAMTADVYRMDFKLMDHIQQQAKNIQGVGFLLYDITTKPPATIEWE